MVEASPPGEPDYTKELINQIVRYFKARDFQVEDEIIDHTKPETESGADALIFIGEKMWGFQTKRPSANKDPAYTLSKVQHERIRSTDWIHYAFPEITSRAEKKIWLSRTIFCNGNFQYKERIKKSELKNCNRWGDIARGIEECPIGIDITNSEELIELKENVLNIIKEYAAIIQVNEITKELRVTVGYRNLIDRRVFRNKGEQKNIIDKKRKVCPHCGRPI